jgi:hypothetical protein
VAEAEADQAELVQATLVELAVALAALTALLLTTANPYMQVKAEHKVPQVLMPVQTVLDMLAVKAHYKAAAQEQALMAVQAVVDIMVVALVDIVKPIPWPAAAVVADTFIQH